MTARKDERVVMVDGVPSLDLRGLEPPQPAVAILTHIEGPDCGDTILVRLDRDPLFLYPELMERGWGWDCRCLILLLPTTIMARWRWSRSRAKERSL